MSYLYHKKVPQGKNQSGRFAAGMSLAEAKQKLTIFDLWQYFGFPGRPSKTCRSPFREDHKPSFSVTPDGSLFHDFATGESGDSVAFFQHATGHPIAQSCRDFIALAGGRAEGTRFVAIPAGHRKVEEGNKPPPCFPPLRMGSPADLAALSALRRIPVPGLEWAAQRGLLRFATLQGRAAWVVTDGARVNAQARRMDGKLWEHIQAKAWTLAGSRAPWPIGIREAAASPSIALCEGGPDLLAAHYLGVWEQTGAGGESEPRCAPVGMLGASLRIPADALPLFADKQIRIFAHADEEGAAAMERWAEQLVPVCAKIDAFSFAGLRQGSGAAVKDLNDAIELDGASLERAGKMMP